MSEGHKSEMERAAEVPREVEPRIYVASLSDYNAGRLHGRWIDAARPVDELWEDIEAMLAASPEPIAEEWAIHDYEGFGQYGLSEYEDLEMVSVLATGIDEHGPAFAAWASLLGSPDLEQLQKFDEAYLGTWQSVEEYAEQLLDDTGTSAELENLSEWLRPYVSINVEGFARDMEIGGDIMTVEDKNRVHVFDAHA
jgi:antirestriction protein